MNLLIVEDDENTASFVRYVLEEEKHNVRIAATVSEAWMHLQEFSPDLFILDRGLPDEDGLRFCRDLRTLKKHARTPVLFLSAMKADEEVAEGMEVGDDYMTKPFDLLDLVTRVQSLLAKAKAFPKPEPA